MNRKTWLLAAIITNVVAFWSASPALADDWMTDFQKARKKAAAENKLLLIHFKDSDVYGGRRPQTKALIALNDDVRNSKELKDWAKDKVVLLEVELTRDRKIQPSAKLRNLGIKLAKKLQVRRAGAVSIVSPTLRSQDNYAPKTPADVATSMTAIKKIYDSALKKHTAENKARAEAEAKTEAMKKAAAARRKKREAEKNKADGKSGG